MLPFRECTNGITLWFFHSATHALCLFLLSFPLYLSAAVPRFLTLDLDLALPLPPMVFLPPPSIQTPYPPLSMYTHLCFGVGFSAQKRTDLCACRVQNSACDNVVRLGINAVEHGKAKRRHLESAGGKVRLWAYVQHERESDWKWNENVTHAPFSFVSISLR